MEGWSGLLERIHWPLPLSENLITDDPTAEPLMIKAERSNLYTMRPDEPRKEGRLALLEASTGEGKLGSGQEGNPSVTWGGWIGVGSPSESCKAGLQRKGYRRSGGIQPFYGYPASGHRSNVPPQASPESPPRSCTRGSPPVTEGIRQEHNFP
jgi:hypothetical protein